MSVTYIRNHVDLARSKLEGIARGLDDSGRTFLAGVLRDSVKTLAEARHDDDRAALPALFPDGDAPEALGPEYDHYLDRMAERAAWDCRVAAMNDPTNRES